MTRQPQTDDSERSAELWVRADVPGGANDRQERLYEQAVDVAAYAAVRTRLVPNRFSLSGLAADSPIGSTISELVVNAKRWAASADVDVDPYLPVTEEGSLASTDTRRVLTFPSVTLVEYTDDEITHVAPHVDDGRVVSVESRLAAVEGGDEPSEEELDAVLAQP